MNRTLLAFVAGTLLAATSRAQDPPKAPHRRVLEEDELPDASFAAERPRYEFLLGVGYARMTLDSGGILDSSDGIHFEPGLSVAPLESLPQVRLGAAVGISLALDNGSGAVVSNDGSLVLLEGEDVTYTLIEPELRVSWRQPLGRDGQFFLEPGVGAGWAFGLLDLSDVARAAGLRDTDSNFFGRAFLRVGARVEGGLAGIEASYLRGGKLDFGHGISGDVGEFYIGIFGALEF